MPEHDSTASLPQVKPLIHNYLPRSLPPAPYLSDIIRWCPLNQHQLSQTPCRVQTVQGYFRPHQGGLQHQGGQFGSEGCVLGSSPTGSRGNWREESPSLPRGVIWGECCCYLCSGSLRSFAVVPTSLLFLPICPLPTTILSSCSHCRSSQGDVAQQLILPVSLLTVFLEAHNLQSKTRNGYPSSWSN